ncbi:MAG: biopolymer transporter ExbD [Prolixibacteraceae bacterium]|jgi:biopolymer transport protein ExbD|nr:biopolymer transporter ExbD [Prolixibacteraceae bacterium]MBT6006680.1 biopolymer transporter ExbD [Prolixibacteraceae bacterium]MBT6763663.1 biopolymer transporter ExbD [Prolixibacteraceae bacterium]MBT7000082.1 biopolymer transporter ExbD [Prolixibacteraceae bacterium]MBT7395094.1 biopolymer transporter ExbD [Prolixibacteraceae bacterium]
MALKRRNKVNAAFSMSSMTDIVFLLLIFFMVTSTLVAPNALKLLLPQSNNQTSAKAITTISITKDMKYYINDEGALKRVAFQEIEPFLQNRYGVGNDDIFISLHAEKSVPWEEVVKIMNIARRNKYKMIAATASER